MSIVEVEVDIKDRVEGVKCLEALPNANFAIGLQSGVVQVWTGDGSPIATFAGHTNWVTCLAALPQHRLASGSGDRTIKVWAIPRSRRAPAAPPVLTLSGHSDWVNCLVALPNGNLVSGSGDNSIKVWNISDGSCMRTLTGHGHWVVALAVLPNNQIASGSKDQCIRLWDIPSGACLFTFTAHTDGVRCLAMLSDGHLASSGDDTNIKLWSIEGKRCVATLSGHRKKVTCLTAMPNDQLASASEDGNFKLWLGKAKKASCFFTKKANDDKIKAITYLTDGRLVTSTNSTITLHTLNSPESTTTDSERTALRCPACHCEFESQTALESHSKTSKSCRPRGAAAAAATAGAGSGKSSSSSTSAGGAVIGRPGAQSLGLGLGVLQEYVSTAYDANTTTKIVVTQSRPEEIAEIKEIKVNKQVILVIDKSGSMQVNDKWAKALNGCRKVLMKLDVEHDWAGFYTFNQQVNCELPVTFLNKDVAATSKGKDVQRKFRDEFNSRIGLLMNTSPEGGTALNDAIFQASTAFVQPKAKGFKVQLELVVLTDGEDCRSSCSEATLNQHLRDLKAMHPWMSSLHLTILGVDIEANGARKMATVIANGVGEVIDVTAGGTGIVDTFREVIESRIEMRSRQFCVEAKADKYGNMSVRESGDRGEALGFSMAGIADSLPMMPPPHMHAKSKHAGATVQPMPAMAPPPHMPAKATVRKPGDLGEAFGFSMAGRMPYFLSVPSPLPNMYAQAKHAGAAVQPKATAAASAASASTIRTCRGCNMRFQDKAALQSHLQLNPQCKTKK